MSISNKLKILAVSAIAALLVVGGLGFLAAANLEKALAYSNDKAIPSIELIYQIKTSQQLIALSAYRHISSTDAQQKSEIEKTMNAAIKVMNDSLTGYEQYLRTDKGRQMLAAEQAAAKDYLAQLPAVLERSNAGDPTGALDKAAPMAKARATLAQLNDAHIDYNEENVAKNANAAKSGARNDQLLSITITLAAALLIGGISWVVLRGVGRSLSAMQGAIARIEGDLDFTTHAEVIGKDEIATVSAALNRLIDKLRASLTTIAGGTHRISDASAQLAQAATQVASASSHQSDAASSMAASVEQMTVSIAHVSDRSGEAHTLSSESGKHASEGEKVIAQTVSDINQIAESVGEAAQRIGELEASSEQISSIVAVIKEVAEQTNLLALNAAIEAARAGEQGRGFAVVADEVRKLAERTSASTQEIATMIGSIRNVSKEAATSMANAVELVNTGVARAGDASSAIQRISGASQHAVTMVEEITAAIREQSQTSTMIAGNVEGIAQMAEEGSAAAQNSADSARALDEVAQEMNRVVSAYRL